MYLENKSDINEIVDNLLQDVETILTNLENSFSDPLENTKVQLEKQKEIIETISDKIPYPSVRYSTPEYSVDEQSKSTIPQISSSNINTNLEQKTHLENTRIEPKFTQEIPIPTVIKKPLEKQAKTLSEPSYNDDMNIISEIRKTQENTQDVAFDEDEDIEFIDISKTVRLIHFFGPPSCGKTTFAIQSAIEIYPKNTYYIITSHSASTIKRIKQMINHPRWIDYKDIKKHIFPITTQNLEELSNEIMKMSKLEPENVGLIVIDHLTDYIRGEIYKEEQRILLREILEQLYLLADEKKCKILIVNGYSYNSGAPAEDIVESFCDMTLTADVDHKGARILIDDEKIDTYFDNSGIGNVHINIYFQS